MCLFALAIVVVLVKQVYTASEKKKEEAAAAAGEVYFKEPSNPARLFSKLYNAAPWGVVIGLLWAGIPTWGAKVNAGWMMLGGWLLVFAVALIFRKFKCGVVFTVINVVVSIGVIYLLCGPAIVRKPAGILRMGLGLRTVPFSTFNMIFIGFLVIGFIIICLLWNRQKKVDEQALAEYEALKAAKAAGGEEIATA